MFRSHPLRARTLPATFVTCIAAAFLLCRPADAARQRVGVVPTVGVMAQADEVAEVDDQIKDGLNALREYDVVDAKQMGAQLASAKDIGLDCAMRSVDCLSKLGVLAGVELIVWARATAKTGGLGIEVTVVDARATSEIGQRTFDVPGRGEQLRAGVHAALTQILKPGADGTLIVEVNVKGARVTANNEELGKSPIPPLSRPPREYRVVAAADGYTPDQKDVALAAGETKKVVLNLVPIAATAPPPPVVPPPPPVVATTTPPPPVVDPAPASPSLLGPAMVVAGFSTLGLGVIGASIGGAFTAFNAALVEDTGIRADERRKAQDSGRWGLVATVGLGVVVVAGGAIATVGLFIE